jgi:hypothetical protein
MSAAPPHAGPHINRRMAWSCDRRPHDRRGDLPSPAEDKRGVPDSLGNRGPGVANYAAWALIGSR